MSAPNVSPAVLYRRSLESRPAVTSEAIPVYVAPTPAQVSDGSRSGAPGGPKPSELKLDPVHGHQATIHRAARGGDGKSRWMGTCSCGWVMLAVTRKQHKAITAVRRQHLDLLKPPKPRCPTPTKLRFKTQKKAERYVELSWRTSWDGYAILCRVYECRCGFWHTTSKPLREKKPCV